MSQYTYNIFIVLLVLIPEYSKFYSISENVIELHKLIFCEKLSATGAYQILLSIAVS